MTGSPLKIMVVDDSNTIRRSAEIFLKQGGHEVLLAEDGFDALSKISDCVPDLIFCDILMPRLDGYQTCAIIKRNERFTDTPVVMLSSKGWRVRQGTWSHGRLAGLPDQTLYQRPTAAGRRAVRHNPCGRAVMPIKHILVVDDSKTELMVLSDLLTRNGYAVATADSADEAMRSLAAHKPDLVLMDVVMPGQNGFQLTRAISRDPQFAGLPIIMCTSKNQETDRVWAMRQGARDYVTKPVDGKELLSKIQALG
jgi:twitching motility two-component system response regulator PilH